MRGIGMALTFLGLALVLFPLMGLGSCFFRPAQAILGSLLAVSGGCLAVHSFRDVWKAVRRGR